MNRLQISIGLILIICVGQPKAAAQTKTSISYFYYYHAPLGGTKKYFVSDVMNYENVKSDYYTAALRERYPEIVKDKASGFFNPFIPNATSKEDLWQKTVAQAAESITSAKARGYEVIEIGIIKPLIKTQQPSTAKPF